MRASVEYLFAGLSIVSTPSQGGRDYYFDDTYCIIAEPNPRSIREAVDALVGRAVPREFVRAKTLARVEADRARYVALVQELIDRTEGSVQFAGRFCQLIRGRGILPWRSMEEFSSAVTAALNADRRRREVSREIGAIARAKYSAEALFARTVPQALERLKARGAWKIIRRRLRRFEQSKPSMQTLAAADVSQLSTQPHWIGARVIHGTSMVVETVDAPWGYSATLPLARLRQSHRGNGDRLFWQVEVEVYAGNVGLSLIDGNALLAERVLKVGERRRTIYLQAEATATDLMVRNGPSKGQSRIAIYNVRLIRIA